MNLFAAAAAAASDPHARRKSKFTFFCNSPFFCLFRLYQILYERLSRMKSLDQHYTESHAASTKKLNKTAIELDFYSNHFEG